MIRNISMTVLAAVVITLATCVDPYNPHATQTDYRLLVVEGSLNDSSGTTTILLSRSTTLSDGSIHTAEPRASVWIEGDDGSHYDLPENSPGSYSASLAIDPSHNFRLNIKTADKKEYLSDFLPFKKTPFIDSLHWTSDGSVVHFYVNSHDAANQTHYYLWRYEETWSYHSAFVSDTEFKDGKPLLRPLMEDIYHCWKGSISTQILVGSTSRLTEDRVSDFELIAMPLTSEKLQSGYSMLVQQYALTKDAYDYWQQLKANTENIGTLFGPQPSLIGSNIRCITDPSEPVIGYFSAGTIMQQRLYIHSRDLPVSRHVTGYEGCTYDTLLLADLGFFAGGEALITGVYSPPPILIGYSKSTFFCVDCRENGGTTVKPDYWD